MVRVLIFLLFTFVSIHGQAQKLNYSETSEIPFGSSIAQNSSTVDLNYRLGSRVLFDYRSVRNQSTMNAKGLALSFFGNADEANNVLVNQRWNEVAIYSILFFSLILNIYLILKIARDPQNFTIT